MDIDYECSHFQTLLYVYCFRFIRESTVSCNIFGEKVSEIHMEYFKGKQKKIHRELRVNWYI